MEDESKRKELFIIRYIKSFKEFIPTWIICVFMFFWIFIWPLVIAFILLIIQIFQKKKILENKVNDSKLLDNEETQSSPTITKLNVYPPIIDSEEIIKKLQIELCEKSDKIDELAKNVKDYNDIKNTMSTQFKKKNNELNKEIDDLKKEIEDKQKIIENLRRSRTISPLIIPLNKKIDSLETENELLKEKINNYSKYADIDNNFILCAGKYKGGIDVPIGCYNFKVIAGNGKIEANVPDNLYEYISSDELNEYSNLDISEKTVIKISGNVKIEFAKSREYDFSVEKSDSEKEFEEYKADLENRKSILKEELSSIEEETETLNNKLIYKYYDFCEYDSLSSEDCKNKFKILEMEEKELREKNKDVDIDSFNENSQKVKERIIRQMLRTFNSECRSFLSDISIKKVDMVKNKIQNSFETINRLYAVDSISLSKELLECKLEQTSLLYTYELKYQQEKDVQRAIKEQMIEEARAEKEIEEQKKKVEKDLQQHIGEVNKLMKYMQKTKDDIQKQLYIDKIKELEEKIKLLESDKEKVQEREVNAKAGFVYIISNIGSFGDDIYKIGMTRRLEPMDRIKELSSASVPFEFDVHAMIFSSDAPELENTLHKYFADKAVNKVNPRKEFYNVGIDEIEKVVKENYNDTVQFTKIPVATEYRQSMNIEEVVP